jgi:predicted phage terminase large subunit-like protein
VDPRERWRRGIGALRRRHRPRPALIDFVREGWPVVEPSAYVHGWHLEEVCAHLEAVSRGECLRLVINVPPGTSKSLITGVFWPTWDWIACPTRRWMFSSYDADLARRDSMRCRELVESDWYQHRWGSIVRVDDDGLRSTMAEWYTTAGGWRYATSVGGKATGRHPDIQVADDPNKPKDVEGGADGTATAVLDGTNRWWSSTMASRAADPAKLARVIIMQRLHERDSTGHVLEHDQGYTHLRLPMEYEAGNPCTTAWGGDRRTEDGELLCPERFDAGAVATLKREMGPHVAAAQLQQRPAPIGGAIFPRDRFQFWRALPEQRMELIQSWDMAFKDSAAGSRVAGHVWGRVGANFYLIDRICEHMGYSASCAAIRRMTERWPKAVRKLVEDKANGPAVVDSMREEIAGLVLVNPEGGKIARAHAVSGLVEAGNVWLPHPELAPWVHDLLHSLVTFPFGRYDDDVDAMTQALLHLHTGGAGRMRGAMAALRADRRGPGAT